MSLKYTTIRYASSLRHCRHGAYHRENSPSYIIINGTVMWCMNGKLHRLDGPAIEYSDGRNEWWVEDKKVWRLNTK